MTKVYSDTEVVNTDNNTKVDKEVETNGEVKDGTVGLPAVPSNAASYLPAFDFLGAVHPTKLFIEVCTNPGFPIADAFYQGVWAVWRITAEVNFLKTSVVELVKSSIRTYGPYC